MASDRQQFNYALNKWDQLRRNGAHSIPADLGSVAILASGYAMESTRHEQFEEINTYEREAHAIRDRMVANGTPAYVVSRFSRDDIFDVLRDDLTSSVITIGNGDLTSIYIDDERLIDWRHLSTESTHLKTGFFEQRHCGQAVRDLSVPLGTFVMKQHSAVRAAVNQFLPTAMTPGHESMIEPVHPLERLSYRTVKMLLPHHFEEEEKDPEHT